MRPAKADARHCVEALGTVRYNTGGGVSPAPVARGCGLRKFVRLGFCLDRDGYKSPKRVASRTVGLRNAIR